MKTPKTAKQIKIWNLEKDLTVALEIYNRTEKRGDRLRVQALREEIREVQEDR
jgi:hypothetical protein